MCSYLVEKVAIVGSAKGPNGWMKIDTAHVYYDHPYHVPLDHALGIDFVNVRNGARGRGLRRAGQVGILADLRARSRPARVD